MAEKKTAISKTSTAKAPPPKAASAPRRGEPTATKKEAAKPVKAPAAKAAAKPAPAPAKAVAPKPAPATPVKVAKPAPAKPEAKAKATTPTPKAPPPKLAKAKPVAPAKAAKPEVKADPKAAKGKAPTPKPAPAPEPKTAKGKKPVAETKPAPTKAAPAKPEKPAKAEKPPKPPKPPKPEKPPKPPKLAPVAAAFAKPMPAKPLAVAAGRAQPILRGAVVPLRVAPKPLAAPKPVEQPEVIGELQPVPNFKPKAGATNKGMVLVGAIAGAFGVKGEVRLRAFTAKPDGVIAYGPLFDEHGKALLAPKSWRSIKEGVAVVAPEVKTKEQADKLRGKKLYVPRANLPKTVDDEYYVVDLLGSRAEALDGTILGEITAVWNFGAGDVLEYRPPNGSPNVRITFSKQAVPHVDLANKRVVLDPPPPEPEAK